MIARLLAAVAMLLLAFAHSQPAIAQQSAPAPPRLRIATRVLAPLVVRAPDGTLAGFSIDLWRAIAAKAHFTSDFVVEATLTDLLGAVERREVDAAVAGISITSQRETTFDFSQPILEAGLQILVREPGRETSLADTFFALFKARALYELIGLLFFLALIPVPFVWWAERHRTGDSLVEGHDAKHGLARTLFWSLATLGGQADDMPRSLAGRVVAIVAIFVSILFVSYFTATTTTILTVRELGDVIRGPSDLPGRVVGTVGQSTAAAYLADEGIRTVTFTGLADAAAKLDAGDVDAIVYDAPVLQYFASHEGRGRVRVTGNVFRQEDYGVLLPSGSTLRKPINQALLPCARAANIGHCMRTGSVAIDAPAVAGSFEDQRG